MELKEILGQTLSPTFSQARMIKGMVESCPADVFRELFKLAERKGYTLALVKEEEIKK